MPVFPARDRFWAAGPATGGERRAGAGTFPTRRRVDSGMRASVVMVACLAGLMLAGCASTAPPGTARPGAAPSTPLVAPSGAGTPTSNKRAATAETQRLLTLFALPGSARRVGSGPKALSGPAMGTPSSGSLVDTVRYWRVPLSLTGAAAWVRAHPPTGLKSDGGGSAHGPDGVQSIGYGYGDDRSSPVWTQAELDIGLAPAGPHASVWRVDGLAQWLDPRPERAPAARHPLAVTVAGGCPAGDRDAGGVTPGPADSLLPARTPTASLICAYTGLNDHAFALTGHARLGAAAAARLAALAGRINLAHTDGGGTSCPADFATATVVAFAYSSGTSAALWLADSGCRYLSNGTIMASEAGGDGAGVQAFATAVARAVVTH